LSKSFATTISPWVVTAEALLPFQSPWRRAAEDPQPLPHLLDPQDRITGSLDVKLEASILTAAMRERGQPPERLSCTSSKHAYWTIAQMIAHHTSNGCNMVTGDLLGTGTQSGPTPSEAGSLLELTFGGREPLTLASGQTRTFLEDGDQICLRGSCEREGFARIGLGSAIGTVAPGATAG
jgi:fumarylacetoacetase